MRTILKDEKITQTITSSVNSEQVWYKNLSFMVRGSINMAVDQKINWIDGFLNLLFLVGYILYTSVKSSH